MTDQEHQPGVTLHHRNGDTHFIPGDWEVSLDVELRDPRPGDPEYDGILSIPIRTGRRDYTLKLTTYSEDLRP